MDRPLLCNYRQCRKPVVEQALVTSCSHVFCGDCAQTFGFQDAPVTDRINCPACDTRLSTTMNTSIVTLNPSEDHKTFVLSGLSPSTIMECAGRGLSFWAYQTASDIHYQEYLYRGLTKMYDELRTQFEAETNEANAEIHASRQKFNALLSEYDIVNRQNADLIRSMNQKSRELSQTKHLYSKIKMKVEMDSRQRTATPVFRQARRAPTRTSDNAGRAHRPVIQNDERQTIRPDGFPQLFDAKRSNLGVSSSHLRSINERNCSDQGHQTEQIAQNSGPRRSRFSPMVSGELLRIPELVENCISSTRLGGNVYQSYPLDPTDFEGSVAK